MEESRTRWQPWLETCPQGHTEWLEHFRDVTQECERWKQFLAQLPGINLFILEYDFCFLLFCFCFVWWMLRVDFLIFIWRLHWPFSSFYFYKEKQKIIFVKRFINAYFSVSHGDSIEGIKPCFLINLWSFVVCRWAHATC